MGWKPAATTVMPRTSVEGFQGVFQQLLRTFFSKKVSWAATEMVKICVCSSGGAFACLGLTLVAGMKSKSNINSFSAGAHMAPH